MNTDRLLVFTASIVLACSPFLPFTTVPLVGQVNLFLLVQTEHDPVAWAWAVVIVGALIALATLASDIQTNLLAAIGVAIVVVSGGLGIGFLIPHLKDLYGSFRGTGGPGLIGVGIPAAAVIYLLFVTGLVYSPVNASELGSKRLGLKSSTGLGIAIAVAVVMAIVAEFR